MCSGVSASVNERKSKKKETRQDCTFLTLKTFDLYSFPLAYSGSSHSSVPSILPVLSPLCLPQLRPRLMGSHLVTGLPPINCHCWINMWAAVSQCWNFTSMCPPMLPTVINCSDCVMLPNVFADPSLCYIKVFLSCAYILSCIVKPGNWYK